MNRLFKISVSVFAGMLILTACHKTPELVLTDVGPDMTIHSWTESTYMGAQIKFSVDVQDKDFALSTLKAKLLYEEDVVSDVTIRTKTNGTYEGAIFAPLIDNNVKTGIATLAFASQNVGMGLTYDTVYVALKRPDFDQITLKVEGQDDVVLKKQKTSSGKDADSYTYKATGTFPAEMSGFLVTPAVNEDGDVITIGWKNDALDASSAKPVTFSSGIAGEYTITADLWAMTADPVGGKADVASVAEYKQGQVLDFGGTVDFNNWILDYDYFVVNDDFTQATFRAADGFYQFSYDTQDKWVKVEPVNEAGELLSLDADGTGAPWVIGKNFGKPLIGPSWDTDNGAYPMAQVGDKVYQFTLTAPGQLAVSGADFKFFHQKGWGGEFLKSDYADIRLEPAFEMTDEGNILGKALTGGMSYTITLDLTGGVKAAKISYEEFKQKVNKLDITVNGVEAEKVSGTVYKVMSAKVDQNSIISFSGIDNPLEWYVDPDHFSITAEGLKFNAVSGYYSFELDLENKFVTVRRVKADGSAATYKDEGAITVMGWGIAHPVMINQLGWDSGQLVTLAEISDGVYQFTGIAVEEKDATTLGGRWRYDNISIKFFGQAGWGVEWGKVTLTEEAQKYLSDQGNVELIVTDDSGDSKTYQPLEKGATYVMTVTDCTPLDGENKFNCTIDFKKK